MPGLSRGPAGPWQASLDRRSAERLQWARWAVRRWSRFPITEKPRPLVLIGARVRAEGGFATGQAELAFVEGRLEAQASVPEGVLEALRQHGPRHSPRAGPALVITDAQLAESEFLTDRGPQRLPAWRLTAEHALGPIWVLDHGVTAWQPAPDAGGPAPDLQAPGQDPGACVEVFSDGRTLVAHWLGGSPVFERYEKAEVIESPHAFAVVPLGEDIGPPGARTLAGHIHHVPAMLRHPLGDRVYVDLHGRAGQVMAAG
jgi:hypothetical protein